MDAAAATPVAPNDDQEKRQGFRHLLTQSTTRYTRRQNVSDNTDSLSQPKEQSQPKIWLKL